MYVCPGPHSRKKDVAGEAVESRFPKVPGLVPLGPSRRPTSRELRLRRPELVLATEFARGVLRILEASALRTLITASLLASRAEGGVRYSSNYSLSWGY